MLEGWQESKGARLELQIARSLDMNVVEQSREDNLDTGNYGQEAL
tara:strand:- start:464 stop:598 length:135 start_codon:yes stop_codon:yes gene_type:complete